MKATVIHVFLHKISSFSLPSQYWNSFYHVHNRWYSGTTSSPLPSLPIECVVCPGHRVALRTHRWIPRDPALRGLALRVCTAERGGAGQRCVKERDGTDRGAFQARCLGCRGQETVFGEWHAAGCHCDVQMLGRGRLAGWGSLSSDGSSLLCKNKIVLCLRSVFC